MNLHICFPTGGPCQWREIPVPSICAWRECAGCGRILYRSRSGWSEVLSDRTHLHWRVLRRLWHRNCWQWEADVHPVFEERRIAFIERWIDAEANIA